MPTFKRKKLLTLGVLALLGCGYCTTMSSLDVNFFLKGYVFMLPVQGTALLYLLYLRLSGRPGLFGVNPFVKKLSLGRKMHQPSYASDSTYSRSEQPSFEDDEFPL